MNNTENVFIAIYEDNDVYCPIWTGNTAHATEELCHEELWSKGYGEEVDKPGSFIKQDGFSTSFAYAKKFTFNR